MADEDRHSGLARRSAQRRLAADFGADFVLRAAVCAGYQPDEASGDSGWGATFEVNHAFALGFTYLCAVTTSISLDMARVYVHAGTPTPSMLSSIAIGFQLPDAKYCNLDLSVAKPVGAAAAKECFAQSAHQCDFLVAVELMIPVSAVS